MNNKMLSTKEAAEYLGVGESRVRQLLGNGTLVGIKVPPDLYRGAWKVKQDSVITYSMTRRKRSK